MSWHYVENGQQKGPVQDVDIERLIAAGAIGPETLVWREGMADWQAYREVSAPSVRGIPTDTSGARAASRACH